MKYRFRIKTGTSVRNVDILNMQDVGLFDGVFLDIDYGDFSFSGSVKPYTPNGFPIVGGKQYFIKGAHRVCFYSGIGTDEEDWHSKFVSYYPGYPVFDSNGQAFTAPLGANTMRFEGVEGEQAFTTDNFYLIEGSEPAQGFLPFSIWSQLDLGDDEPAMTYQANDIAELKDRQADYSQELKLPLTAHNLTVLGLPDHIDSQTDFPYKTVECRLFADEYELAGKGAVLVIDGVTDAIECQVLGSSASLFDLLEDSPMSDLTEPSFTRDYGGDLVPAVGANPWPNGFEFVAASFTKGGFHHLLEMNPVYMLPVVNDLYLLGKILEAHGYTWVHNLAGYAGTSKNALPVVTLDPDADSFDRINVHAGRTISEMTATFKYYHLTRTDVDPLGTWTNVGSDGGATTATYSQYVATDAGKIRIVLDITGKVGTALPIPGSIHVWVATTPDGGEQATDYEEYVALMNTSIPKNITLELDLAKGDVVKFRLGRWANSSSFPTSFTLALTHLFEHVPLYGLVHAPRNLGFDTQFDYFKAFVQRYGLTVRVDHATSTVYTYTMKQVYDNKAFARDWSDKLVERGGEMSFRADGYARSNDIAFKDNGEDNVTDKGTFAVADTNLEKEKTLFDLPFDAGLDWGATDKYASIPVFDVPDLDLTDSELNTDAERLAHAEYSGGRPHLVRVSSDTVSMGDTSLDFYDYHRATHVTAQSLIDTYYTELTDSMLVKAKSRVDTFYLTPADIEAFDPFVPVYIRQYGAYFYVNKISNFIVGRLTSVELIKL